MALLTTTTLQLCVPLWPDRLAFSDKEFAQALAACRALLDQRRALGAVVLEGEHARAYGISAFVHEAFADAYVAAPHPQIGKRVLLDEPPFASILDLDQIAEGNARGGLHMVVLSTNYDLTAANPAAVLGLLMQAFVDVHRGYRLERVINEVIGDAAIDMVTGSGAYGIDCVFGEIAAGRKLRSAVCVLTRERAAERKSSLLPLFVYNPPRVLFTPAEQALLMAALDGAPDEVVSARLGIPLSATKARWTRIHQRVAARLPDLVDGVSVHQSAARRGPQTRHLILKYVRENPSELTPYARRHRASSLSAGPAPRREPQSTRLPRSSRRPRWSSP